MTGMEFVFGMCLIYAVYAWMRLGVPLWILCMDEIAKKPVMGMMDHLGYSRFRGAVHGLIATAIFITHTAYGYDERDAFVMMSGLIVCGVFIRNPLTINEKEPAISNPLYALTVSDACASLGCVVSLRLAIEKLRADIEDPGILLMRWFILFAPIVSSVVVWNHIFHYTLPLWKKKPINGDR